MEIKNIPPSPLTSADNCLSRDICDIIKTCAQSGVASLKWGDFHVSFAFPSQPVIVDLPKTTADGFASQASEQELSVDSKLSTVDRELLEDMARAQLIIDDPLAYEQAMVDAQLRRAENGELYDSGAKYSKD